MLTTPQIVVTTALHTAVIHLTVPFEQIREVMGPGLRELQAELAAQGVSPLGPWFTHHLQRPEAVFDFEISLPVPAPIAASDRMRPSTWPAMKVARTVYTGPYEELGEGWGEFMGWIAANGFTATPDLWERYLSSPEDSDDPATWRTELSQPLLG